MPFFIQGSGMRLPVITLLLSPHSLIVVGFCIMGKIGKNATSGLKNIEIGKFLIVILSQKIISFCKEVRMAERSKAPDSRDNLFTSME